ncbi:MAG: hypothetical protein ACK595_00185 [Planctomycetota bacterium]
MIRPLTSICLATTAIAQGTYVVDIANGPGTNYTQIQAAVTAVPNGSVLRVRQGIYAPVTVSGKAIAILCDAGARVGDPTLPFLRIQGTQSNQPVLVQGLVPTVGTPGAQITNANGPVIHDGSGQVVQATMTQFSASATVVISNSLQVAIRNATILGGVSSGPSAVNGIAYEACNVVASTVTIETCTLRGMNASSTIGGFSPGRPGLVAANSRIMLTGCTIAGGNGVMSPPPFPTPGGAAISSSSCLLHVRGDSLANLTGGVAPGYSTIPPTQYPAIAGTGSLWIDPAVQLTGTVATTLATTTAAMPRMAASVGVIGGILFARRDGPPGTFSAVALSLPAAATTTPGIADPIWLDGTNFFVATFGIAPANGLSTTINVPNQPSLAGFLLAWQAADFGPNGIAAVSNPSLTFLR